MKLYLSASYVRKPELQGYRNTLICLGHEVTSQWLDEPENEDDGYGMHVGPDYCFLAERDVYDIDRADGFVAFTEAPGGYPRGGRHVEYGIAIAKCKQLFVVGYRENAFHHLPHVMFYDNFEHFTKWYGPVLGVSK